MATGGGDGDEVDPYRSGGGDPDAEAREVLAIQRYGTWSMGVRARVLGVSAAVGVASMLGVVAGAFWLALPLPIIALVVISAGVGGGIIAIGGAVARKTVRQRARPKLLELAAAHDVPVERLEQTTSLSNTL